MRIRKIPDLLVRDLSLPGFLILIGSVLFVERLAGWIAANAGCVDIVIIIFIIHAELNGEYALLHVWVIFKHSIMEPIIGDISICDIRFDAVIVQINELVGTCVEAVISISGLLIPKMHIKVDGSDIFPGQKLIRADAKNPQLGTCVRFLKERVELLLLCILRIPIKGQPIFPAHDLAASKLIADLVGASIVSFCGQRPILDQNFMHLMNCLNGLCIIRKAAGVLICVA